MLYVGSLFRAAKILSISVWSLDISWFPESSGNSRCGAFSALPSKYVSLLLLLGVHHIYVFVLYLFRKCWGNGLDFNNSWFVQVYKSDPADDVMRHEALEESEVLLCTSRTSCSFPLNELKLAVPEGFAKTMSQYNAVVSVPSFPVGEGFPPQQG